MMEDKEYATDDGDRTLTGALYNLARMPAFVVELGGPMVVYKEFEDLGVIGVKNVLFSLGMLKKNWALQVDQSKIKVNYPLRTCIISAGERSGFVRYEVKLGAEIKRGQRIATISNIFGKVKGDVCSPMHGFMISMGYSAITQPGTIVAILAVKDSDP